MYSNITFLKTNHNVYLYDGNTGHILKIDQLIQTMLQNDRGQTFQEVAATMESGPLPEEVQAAWQRIEEAKALGLLSPPPKEIYLDYMLSEIRYTTDHFLGSITLCLTQQCNLRCEYCAYSGIYGESKRTHANKHMTFDIAKKAIDYAIGRSTSWDRFHISFYGGEPLIRYQLIQEIIAYTRAEFPGKNINFGITTNGTLLTEEKFAYFLENQIRVYVSLDGPEEFHDEYRRYAGTNEGTYQDIRRNLLALKEQYPDYYRNLVHFGMTLSPYRSLGRIEEFLTDNELIMEETFTRISNVNHGYELPMYEQKRSEEIIKKNRVDEKFLWLRFLHSKIRGNDEFLFKTRLVSDFCQRFDVLEDRRKSDPSERILPGGPCVIGSRLFVTAEGDYYMCEKCNEASDVLKIGDVNQGVDLQKAEAIIRDYYLLTEKECLHCWAHLLCSICPAQVEKDGELSREEKLKRCNTVRNRYRVELERYLEILEHNPTAFM